MSHGPGRYQTGGHGQYSPNMNQMPNMQYQHRGQVDEIAFGMKNLGMGPPPGQPNNGMMMQDVYHPTDTNRAAARGGRAPVNQLDFLQGLGGGFTVGPRVPPQHGGTRSPARNTMASAIPPQRSPYQQQHMQHQPVQHQPVQRMPQPPIQQPPIQQPPIQQPPIQQPPIQQSPRQQPLIQQQPSPLPPSSTSLSVAASEFVPGFRKPEKTIVLYTQDSFKKKSRADDEMAINDVSSIRKLIDI